MHYTTHPHPGADEALNQIASLAGNEKWGGWTRQVTPAPDLAKEQGMNCPICDAKMKSFNWTKTGKLWICPNAQAERIARILKPKHNRVTWRDSELRDSALPVEPVKQGGIGWK